MQEKAERFWSLLEPEYGRASAFCRKLAGDRDRGDDLLQDALVKALVKLEQLRDEKSFRPWLYRVIVSTFRSTARQPWWKRKVRLTETEYLEPATDDPEPRHQARRWLQRALSAVTPQERALVVLFEVDQWTVAELAELYQATESAIKVRLHRTRKKMKQAILKYLDADQTKAKEARPCAAVKPGIDS